MKKATKGFLTMLIITVAWQCTSTFSYAQVPEKFNYQAVVRDSSGSIISGQAVSFRISIIKDSVTGTAVYVETHSDTTNTYGLSVLKIGEGIPSLGSMKNIDWINGPYFIKVELDQKGGGSYVLMGITQLKSVPYAFHSKTADSISGTLPETDPVFGLSPSNGITNTNILNWNTAYGWGNHASAGYLTSFTETDPIYTLWDKDYNDMINRPDIGDSIDSKAVLLTGNQTVAGDKTFTGTISANNNVIINVADPVDAQDAATKAYVDAMEARIKELEIQVILIQGLTDIDGNHYNTVRIGDQIWMKEDLKTTKYRDGTTLQRVMDEQTFISLNTGAYCWYNFDSATYSTPYGALYNWYAVSTGNLCPVGWHVPTNADWNILGNYLMVNGYNYDGSTTGNKYGKAMASAFGWQYDPGVGTVGNTDYPEYRNKSGFTALPSGLINELGYMFGNGSRVFWWSATEESFGYSWSCYLVYNYVNLLSAFFDKHSGYSVRCLKDNVF